MNFTAELGDDSQVDLVCAGPINEAPLGADRRSGDERYPVVPQSRLVFDSQQRIFLRAAKNEASDDVDDVQAAPRELRNFGPH
jgi:hypothetical protein